MRNRLPFAVVGSNTVVTDEEGNMVRGREYPWGTVNIEDKVGNSVDELILSISSSTMIPSKLKYNSFFGT